MGNGPKPVETKRRKSIQVAIWRNENENGVYHTVSHERRYVDAKGEWHTTQTYGRDDLLLLANMLIDAHAAIFRLQEGEKSKQAAKPRTAQPIAAGERRGQGR